MEKTKLTQMASLTAFALLSLMLVTGMTSTQVAFGQASEDTNGLEYIQPDGYTVTYGTEYFNPLDMVNSNGHATIYFKGKNTDSFLMAGYVALQDCTPHTTEKTSFVLGGGPRNTVNPTWADSLDLEMTTQGSDNAQGNDIEASRLRVLESFPTYSSAITPGPVTFDLLPNGDDITYCSWVSGTESVYEGFAAMKLNVDEDDNGQPDHVAVQAWIDPTGRAFQEGGGDEGAPNNNWEKVFDGYYECDDLDPLKSCYEPYVQTIGQASETYHSFKANNQFLLGDEVVPDHAFFTLKNITSVEIDN